MAKRRRKVRIKGGKASPFVRQVQAESGLRFGAEEDALVGLVGQARKTARTRTTSVDAASRGLGEAIGARESLAARAAGAHAATQSLIASQARGNTAGLGPSADPFKGIIESELAGSGARAAETERRYADELGQQRTSAARYRASETGRIGSDLDENLSSIGDRLRSLEKEKGTFASARLGELTESRRGRSHDLRKIRLEQRAQLNAALAENKQQHGLKLEEISAGGQQTRQTERLKDRLNPGGGSKKTGKRTAEERRDSRKVYREILDAATAYKTKKRQRLPDGGTATNAEVREALTTPRMTKDGVQTGGLGLNPTVVGIAEYLAYHGRLDQANYTKAKGLGLAVPKRWRPKGKVKTRRKGR